MNDKQHQASSLPPAVSASLLALVVFLGWMLYLFGTAMSGDGTKLTESVHGATIIDTRDVSD